MIDRIFAPVLTFVMLIAGTAAITSTLFAPTRTEVLMAQGMPPEPIMLETVVVTGKRVPPEALVAGNEKSTSASAAQAAEGRGVLLHRAQD